MLQIVEHEQHRPLPEIVPHALGQRLAGRIRHPRSLRDQDRNLGRFRCRVEGHEHHAIRETRLQSPGGAEGQTGLADATWTSQGEETDVEPVKQVEHHPKLMLTPHERGEGTRQRIQDDCTGMSWIGTGSLPGRSDRSSDTGILATDRRLFHSGHLAVADVGCQHNAGFGRVPYG